MNIRDEDVQELAALIATARTTGINELENVLVRTMDALTSSGVGGVSPERAAEVVRMASEKVKEAFAARDKEVLSKRGF